MAELAELNELLSKIQSQYDPEARLITELLQQEIKRRTKAGRPVLSKLSRREQNQAAQRKHRAKKLAVKAELDYADTCSTNAPSTD